MNPPKKWRSSRSIKGVRARVQAAINGSQCGSECTIEIGTALSLLEICDQAIHTEVNHEPPEGTEL